MNRTSTLLKSGKLFKTRLMQARQHWIKQHDSKFSQSFQAVNEGNQVDNNHSNRTQQLLNKLYPKAKFYYFGNELFLLGCEEDDGSSCDNTINNLELLAPSTLILGGVSDQQLRHHIIGEHLYYLSGPKLSCTQKDAVARKRLSYFFN